MSQNPFRYVKALVIALVVFATILAVLPVAGVSSGDPGDDVGPAADTGVPRYQAFSTDPPYPGPSRPVDVTARVQDESDNLTVTMSYGYDNATWSAMSASRSGNMTPRSTVRNPVSGTTTGTLSATYSPNAEITFLNVYIYSADSDTCWVRIRGYEPISAAWTNLYSATNTGSGTKVNTDLWGSGYSQWDILFYDTEGNDAIYYTAMYDVLHQNYTATIPQAGTHTKVYYFFNASDPSGNNATSNVMNYSVDTTPPMIIDFTKPASLQRVANAIDGLNDRIEGLAP